MRLVAAPCICTALLLVACGDSEGGRDTQDTAASVSVGSSISATAMTAMTVDPSGDDTGLTSAASEDSGGVSASADDSDGAPKFDVGGNSSGVDPDSGEPVEGCQKIDFLFVVDNSGSMEEEQISLANSFDGFISSIQNTVMAKDYHIMVIDTDAGSSFLQECMVLCAFPGFMMCEGYPCDMLPVPSGCDASLGAGLLQNPQGDSCGIAGDKRYMVDGQPNLAETFSCLAKVGTNGDGSERPMEAMIAGIDGPTVVEWCRRIEADGYSTIGFGELPYAFTPAQRMWTTVSIYLTVLGWLYAFGAGGPPLWGALIVCLVYATAVFRWV